MAERSKKSPIDRMMGLVPVDAVVQQVDVQGVVDRIDIDALLERIDINELVARVDFDAVVQRLDLETLVERSVRSATSGTLDLARQRLRQLDDWVTARMTRLLRRNHDADDDTATDARPDAGPQDEFTLIDSAGSATRMVAFIIDAFLSVASITLIMATVVTFVDLITGAVVDMQIAPEISAPVTFIWVLLYFFTSWAAVGRTPGMAMSGVLVVAGDGGHLTTRRAAVRTVAFPFSFIFGIGLAGILVGKRHRALHDVVAGTAVAYD